MLTIQEILQSLLPLSNLKGMKLILSEIIWITPENISNREEIEKILTQQYGSLIRWAIVDLSGNKLKISVTYEKGV